MLPVNTTSELEAGSDKTATERPAKGLWRETFERLIRKPSAIVGLAILSFLIFVALAAPLLAPYDPLKVLDLGQNPQEGIVRRMSGCIHLLGCPGVGDAILSVSTPETVSTIAFNSTNTRLLAASGNIITVFNAENGQKQAVLEHDAPVTAAIWSPTDNHVVSASGDELYIWDANSWERISTEAPLLHSGGVTFLDWQGQQYLLSADQHTARIWDTGLWAEAFVISDASDAQNKLEGELVGAGWNINGTVLMTASGNNVQLWSPTQYGLRMLKRSGEETTPIQHDAPVLSARFSKDRTRIQTVSNNKLYIWEAGQPYGNTQTITYEGNELTDAVWSEDAVRGVQYILAISENTALVWDAKTGKLIRELNHGEPILSLAGSPKATRIFTQSETRIRVWDLANGEEVLSVKRAAPISATAWQSSGGGVFVASGADLAVIKTSDYQYIMGIDGNMRDLFSRVIYGTRLSLMVGLTTVTLAVILGTILGSIAGYAGGWIDNIIMRIMDVMLAFPSLILAIAVVSVLGPGLINALLAISIVFIPAYARVARSGVLAVREEDFVTADRVLGVRPSRILFRRILPNALAPLIVQATLGIGTAILDAAALSFLGLGAQPPTPEWGAMLGAERSQILTAPHLVFYPGIAIMITVLAFNLLGDGLRDALDPRLDR